MPGVSPVGDKATATRRPHDAEASRRALLEAAQEVFETVGYDRATTREIGERAGVDPALIARYFESKEGLFLAAIAAGSAEADGMDFAPRALVGFLLERWDEQGHSPISRALASPTLLTFTTTWNDYLGPLLYLRSPGNWTLQLGLQTFIHTLYNANYAWLFAGLTLSVIPIAVIFGLGQRYFIAGIATSGLKG